MSQRNNTSSSVLSIAPPRNALVKEVALKIKLARHRVNLSQSWPVGVSGQPGIAQLAYFYRFWTVIR